jgi:hypothetical protein
MPKQMVLWFWICAKQNHDDVNIMAHIVQALKMGRKKGTSLKYNKDEVQEAMAKLHSHQQGTIHLSAALGISTITLFWMYKE